jgi:UDP-N-acetylglucosamine--N-acetylmuramyl-(pentapeptide) pyrophosphoryl-undecaprenol N-acetylglucosamine transferase
MLHSDMKGATLLVASTGGHLEELERLRRRFVPEISGVEWVTFDDAQSRSLLRGQSVHYVDYIPPRGYTALARNLGSARRILRGRPYARIVTTGSGIAIPYLTIGRAMGIPCHYIESAARAQGPSFTGSYAARVPGVQLHTQYQIWAQGKWRYSGSLFDGYQRAEVSGCQVHQAKRVVVTLGTMRSYGFRAAVERLVAVLPSVLAPDAEVLWQVGATDVSHLGIQPLERVPALEMRAAIKQADLVVAHAGIGSALTVLDAGKCPVLLPRRQARGEHVDDHQLMIAAELASRDLAVTADATSVTAEDLQRAMATSVATIESQHEFQLAV